MCGLVWVRSQTPKTGFLSDETRIYIHCFELGTNVYLRNAGDIGKMYIIYMA